MIELEWRKRGRYFTVPKLHNSHDDFSIYTNQLHLQFLCASSTSEHCCWTLLYVVDYSSDMPAVKIYKCRLEFPIYEYIYRVQSQMFIG